MFKLNFKIHCLHFLFNLTKILQTFLSSVMCCIGSVFWIKADVFLADFYISECKNEMRS